MCYSLCDLIKRVAYAKRVGDSDMLNSSLAELSRAAEALFRAKIERDLGAAQGFAITLDDACDVLNEILWQVCLKADDFRGETDSAAYGWLKRIVERRTIDAARVAIRRSKKWREVLSLVPKKLKRLLDTKQDKDDDGGDR